MQGYQILEACNGVEAVDLLTNQRIDLLISDLIMPQVDGLQLVERIQAQSPKTPVILVTAYLSRKSETQGSPGLVEVLTKPVDLEILVAKVERLLRRSV